MPYSHMLGRAFRVVRREPALWVLGFIFGLFGGGGGFDFSTNANVGDVGSEDFFRGWEGAPPDLPAWFNPETLVILVLTIICLALVLMAIGLVVQSIAWTGLIRGTARASEGEDVGWIELWRFGVSSTGRRVLGLRLLLAIPALAGFFLAVVGVLVIGLPLIRTVSSGATPSDAAIVTLIGSLLLLIPLVLILVLAGWVFSLIGNYAAREIVLEDRAVMASFREGWNLLKQNVVPTVVFSLILGVIGAVVGFVMGFVLLFIGLLVGLPLFFLLVTQGFPPLLTVVMAIGGAVLIALITAIVNGPLLAYYETTWTLVWRHLTGEQAADETFASPAVG